MNVLGELEGDEVGKRDALRSITKTLTTLGQIDQVIEIVETMNEQEKLGELLIILKELIATQRISEALEIAKKIPEESKKSKALWVISATLAEAHLTDKALEIAEMISGESEKSDALCVISEELASTGSIDKAIELVKSTSKASVWYKFKALGAILTASKKLDDFDLVASYARTLSNQTYKELLLVDLFKQFIRMDRVDKALEVSRDIFQHRHLWDISKRLWAIGKVNEAKEVFQRISDEKNP